MKNQPPPPKEYFRICVQVGAVVRDLDQTIRVLTDVFGFGPFRVIDWPPAGRTDIEEYYYGKPVNTTARKAFTDLGAVELELIQPIEGESIWADFLKKHGPGLHHIRFNVPELEPVVEYLGESNIKASQVGSGIRPGTVWANFDTEDIVGFTIEVMKTFPGTDGKTPVIADGKVLV
jgi:catechol 2,3-dioxygenase-like lactoylglutathione lyase family enzyme